ncbi:adenylate/guanylate cyclase domain-containing protein [Helicobacter burdigaliensis]|uniref:adenylate/guanylate cyclase domain-containing protein n=1 Tax=Helicobacter burdigaliensis TaxID=2315334 RepID=UPI000EF65C20|nr:adenylate/guanylate cyclase domain-containing protein [Helicobacter burdigaliensis]
MDYTKTINELYSKIKTSKNIEFEKYNTINASNIQLETNKVAVIDDVTCVFVDMENSTEMAIGQIDKALKIQIPYIRALVEIFQSHETKYIDIQGDGGFALFDGDNSMDNGVYAAAMINTLFNKKLNMNIRIGIDCGRVYVQKAGKRGENKEIWLGRPVCLASKLCNIGLNTISKHIRFSKNISSSSVLTNIDKTIYNQINNLGCIYASDFTIS